MLLAQLKEELWFRINLSKSLLSPSKRISFLGEVFNPNAGKRSLKIQRLAASFKVGDNLPLKMFQKLLGLMAAASSVVPLGLLHMQLLQHWLKARIPLRAWTLILRVTHSGTKALVPWKEPHLYQLRVELGLPEGM